MAGGVLGVLGVIAMRIGLKATIVSDDHNVVLIRSVMSIGGFATFGLAVALIVAGAWVGRRKIAAEKNEGPVEHQAPTGPALLPNSFGFPDSGATSTYDSKKLPDEHSSSSSSF